MKAVSANRSETPKLDVQARRWRNRALALLLGMVLAPLVTYGAFFVMSLPTSGTQVCERCRSTREAFGIAGVFVHSGIESPAGIPSCEDHVWARTGCWDMAGGGVTCYFAP